MIHHLIHLLVTAVAVLVAERIVPGIRVRSFGSAVVFAFVLAVLNVILGKILVVLALPFILLTLGLFLIIINGFLFWLADKVVKGVEVDGFGAAILGSLLTSLVSWGIMFLFSHL
jgi:putative membrane protein